MVFEIKEKSGVKIWASKDGMVKLAMNFLKEKGCEIKWVSDTSAGDSAKEIPFIDKHCDDFLFSEESLDTKSEIEKYTED